MARVEVAQLSFSFGSRAALKNVSFSLQPDQNLALLGPNGSGKSTLLRILATLLAPQSGTVTIDGVATGKMLQATRRKIGVVFQNPSVDKRLTVEENLRHHAQMFGLKWSEVSTWAISLLDRLGLADRRREMVKSLSGGLERRVELAKALVHRPSLLLLDEPTSGLDPTARSDFWDLVRSVRGELGLAVITSTHLLDEAEACDLLLMLSAGSPIAFGSPRALLEEIGSDVVSLEGPSPALLEQRIAARYGARVRTLSSGLRFVLPQSETFSSAVEWLKEIESDLTGMSITKPGLEDLYTAHTGKRWEGNA